MESHCTKMCVVLCTTALWANDVRIPSCTSFYSLALLLQQHSLRPMLKMKGRQHKGSAVISYQPSAISSLLLSAGLHKMKMSVNILDDTRQAIHLLQFQVQNAEKFPTDWALMNWLSVSCLPGSACSAQPHTGPPMLPPRQCNTQLVSLTACKMIQLSDQGKQVHITLHWLKRIPVILPQKNYCVCEGATQIVSLSDLTGMPDTGLHCSSASTKSHNTSRPAFQEHCTGH